MGMYNKDKTEVLKIRVTPEQSDFLSKMAASWGVTKSQVVRAIIDTYRVGGPNHENK